MTTLNFTYSTDPVALGINISPDAEFRWCINRAAKRSHRLSQREYAATLIAQWGNWTDKQQQIAHRIWCNRISEYRICLSEECRNRSVRRFITEVGTDAALAHAFELREEAARIRGKVSDGKEYADSHDRYSDLYWRAREDAAARKVEMADRIVRIAEKGGAA